MAAIICTVSVSGSARCGAPAVHSWESRMSGEIFAECAEHHRPVAAVEAPSLVGSKVEIHWHSWAKVGRIVEEKGSKVMVSFVPSKKAEPIVRAFPLESVKFI